jgi:hypothetical protein
MIGVRNGTHQDTTRSGCRVPGVPWRHLRRARYRPARGCRDCEGRHRRRSSRLTIPVSKTRSSGMAVEVGIGDGWLTLVAPGLAGEPRRLDEAAVRQPRKN